MRKLYLIILNIVFFLWAAEGASLNASEEIVVSKNVAASARAETISPVQDSSLTLELQGVNILDVFKLLSKKSGLNIVAGRNVQGQVSIFLQNVPVREALQTILESQGLAAVEENGIVKVMSDEDYQKKFGKPYGDRRLTRTFKILHAQSESLAAKLQEIKSEEGRIYNEARTNTLVVTDMPEVLGEMEKIVAESDQPQQSETFELRYVDPEDFEARLKTLMDGAGGHYEMDKQSGRVLVFDIPSHIDRVRELVRAFDVRPEQVLIEAKIVEVRLSDSYRKGIDWQEIMNEVGDFNTIRALAPLAVSPPTGAASLATLALGSGQDDLQIVFQWLERVGKTNLLSSPRLMALNRQEAKLAVATRQPFVSQTVVQTVNSTNTADNVQFVDVGVTLKVTPTISSDGVVEMKIKPAVSSSGSSLELEGVSQGSDTTFTRTRIPIVTTQELQTTVQIQSGRTLVIGGLIQDQQGKDSSRIPFLASVPLLGKAFRSESHDFTKTELVIFLTPTIIPGSENTRETSRFLTRSNQIKPFDPFAGYPVRLRYGAWAKRQEPFWDFPEKNIEPISQAGEKS